MPHSESKDTRKVLKSGSVFSRGVARADWLALIRRINSPAGFRALLVVFVVTVIVFSALPLLRYFRGRTLFDYKLWYETEQYVLAGHEIYFFRSGKYDFMYPPPCALFLAGASLLGQGGLILLLVAINSRSEERRVGKECRSRWSPYH